MNIDELRDHLQHYYTEGTGTILYMIFLEAGESQVRLVDIDHDDLKELKEMFLNGIKETIVDDENQQIRKLSTADDRGNVLYEYDLEEVPSELNVFSDIHANGEQQQYSSRSDAINDLYAYIIVIGDAENKLCIYKKHYPINTYSGQKHFFLFESEHRFKKMQNDMIKINNTFDILYIHDTILIKNIRMFEKFYGFHDIAKRQAMQSIAQIQAQGILDNPGELAEDLEDAAFSRRLIQTTSDSPVLGKIPVEAIIVFTKTYPTLQGKFKYSGPGTQIHLDTKKSKILFLKMLNDDFLQSELTKAYYDSLAKDNIVIESQR